MHRLLLRGCRAYATARKRAPGPAAAARADLAALDARHARVLAIARRARARHDAAHPAPKPPALLAPYARFAALRAAFLDTLPLLDADADADMAALARDETAALLAQMDALAAGDLRARALAMARQADDPTAAASAAPLGALLEIKPGVGGAEGALFCADLERMYTRFLTARGLPPTPVQRAPTDGGGLREVLMEVRARGGGGAGGPGPYELLRFESGAHRVQRVPATESAGRVHTSTASVLVLPLVEEGAEPSTPLYRPEDVRIEVMRARGAGGQHVNKTESAVRLTHVPTGIVVAMQDERSQHVNRRRAFTVLASRLLAARLAAEAAARRSRRNRIVGGVERSDKIRTYNWPQARITDHRVGLSVSLEGVMEGPGLATLIDALAADHEERLLEELEEELGEAGEGEAGEGETVGEGRK
ncbi:hypothetical protein HDZ31DRAFT_62683 [Schizophyllum fasciatum]